VESTNIDLIHATSEELKAQVREHISSFPSQESYYLHHDNKKRRYLPETLSIARMHRLYLEKYEPELDKGEKPYVKEWLYRKIFNEEFNYGFGYCVVTPVKNVICSK